MRKKFLSDFFFIQILNLLVKGVWILGIDRKVQNVLPAAEYGTYFSLTGLSLLFMILIDLGLTNLNNREVSIDREFNKHYFNTIAGTKFLLTIGFFILGFLVGKLLNFTPSDYKIFGLLALNQALLSFNMFFRSNISAIHKFKLDGILSVIDRLFVVLSLIVIIWTVWTPIKLSLDVYILAQTIGLLLTFTISWLANIKLFGKPDQPFHFDKAKVLLKKALPYAAIIALMTIYTRVDSVLILKLMPDGRSQASSYAMCYRLLDAAAIIGALLAGQLLPLFASNLINKARLLSIAKWASILVLVPAVIATFICSINSAFLMNLLYPEKYNAEVGTVFSILIWCIPGMVLVNIFGTLLTAAGQIKRINQIALITCFINIVGNLLLINTFGLAGVAATAVITQLFFGGMCYLYARLLY